MDQNQRSRIANRFQSYFVLFFRLLVGLAAEAGREMPGLCFPGDISDRATGWCRAHILPGAAMAREQSLQVSRGPALFRKRYCGYVHDLGCVRDCVERKSIQSFGTFMSLCLAGKDAAPGLHLL